MGRWATSNKMGVVLKMERLTDDTSKKTQDDTISLSLQWKLIKHVSKLTNSATPVCVTLPLHHDNHFQISQCGTVKNKYRVYCFSENKLEMCLKSSRF